MLKPPVTPPELVDDTLARQGYAVLDAAGGAVLLGAAVAGLEDWRACWDDLPPDAYLKDGGRYRRRRHSCFVVEGDAVRAGAFQRQLRGVDRLHRAHGVPLDARDLHQPADRVAGQSEVVLHADFGGVFDLAGSATAKLNETCGSH